MVSIARTVFVADMSITIHLEEFQSWSEVFDEIERQRKMMLFEIIRPNPSAIHDREKKRRSLLRVGEDVASVKEKRTTSNPVKYNREGAVLAHHVPPEMRLSLIIQMVYCMILDLQMQQGS